MHGRGGGGLSLTRIPPLVEQRCACTLPPWHTPDCCLMLMLMLQQVNSTSRAYHVITLLAATIPPLSALPAPGIDLVWRWGVPRNSLDHTLCLMLIRLAKTSVRNCQAMLVRRGLRGEMCEIVFSSKIVSPFFPFYPQTFWPSCLYNRGKLFFILVIVEINCMT